jgi:hypothetical protein
MNEGDRYMAGTGRPIQHVGNDIPLEYKLFISGFLVVLAVLLVAMSGAYFITGNHGLAGAKSDAMDLIAGLVVGAIGTFVFVQAKKGNL